MHTKFAPTYGKPHIWWHRSALQWVFTRGRCTEEYAVAANEACHYLDEHSNPRKPK